MGCCSSSFDDEFDDQQTVVDTHKRNSNYNSTAYQRVPEPENSKTDINPPPQATPPAPVPVDDRTPSKHKHKGHNKHTYEEIPPAPPSLIPTSHSPPRLSPSERVDLLARIADLEKNGRAIDVKTIAEKDNQLARMSAEVAQKELQCQELSAEKEGIFKERELLCKDRDASLVLITNLRTQIRDCFTQLEANRQDNNRLRELFEQVSLKTVVPQVSPLVAQPPMSVEQDQNMPRMYIPNNPISDAENKQQEVTQLPTTDNLDDLATLVSDISLPDLDNALDVGSEPPTQAPAVEKIEDAPKLEVSLIKDCGSHENINLAGLRRGRKAPTMEDTHFCEFPWNGNDKLGLFCVFDGFVSKDASQRAKTLFPEVLYEIISHGSLTTDAKEIFQTCFAAVDQKMRDFEDVGTTCTAVLVWSYQGKRYVQAANLGDSCAFLCRGNKAIALSEEHKVEKERARLEKDGVELNPHQSRINGISVARALGIHFVKDMKLGIIAIPYVSPPFAVCPEDAFIVVCSDGVWDVFTDPDKACEVMLSTEQNATSMARKLIAETVNKPVCHDNVTAVVARL